MPTKLEANASFKKPRFVFLVLALALVFGVVFVGGVCGATWNVPEQGSLAYVVKNAANNDIIVIHGDENDEYTITEQVWLGPKEPNDGTTIKSLTITNEQGKHVTIKSGLTSGEVDKRTLFIITGGTLTIEGGNQGGSLTITTNYNGRAFDVNFDRRPSTYGGENDDISSKLIMNDNVDIEYCGFDSDGNDDGGAIYIRSGGELEMNGGRLMYNKAGAGGAVIVDGGLFDMNGGLIYGNQALDTKTGFENWAYDSSIGGGGVYITSSSGTCDLMGGVIYGNSAEKTGDAYQQVYGGDYNGKVPFWISLTGKDKERFYLTIKDAYEDKDFSGYVYLHGDITQFPNEKITVDKSLTILPAGQNVKLVITESSLTGGMFEVTSSGSLTFQNNGGYSLTVSGTNSLEGKGGAVYIDGGSFTLSEGVTMSGLKAENGGAIYLNSGTCTLEGGKIQDCLVSGDGAAVYVAGGTFTVKNGATIASSNDVYLTEDQVIYAEPDYTGSVGKITLPSYADGTVVVDTGSDASGYIGHFALNQDGNDEVERVLILKEGSPNYLIVKNNVEYEVIIPPQISILESTKTGTIPISVTNLKIPSTSAVKVYIHSDFELDYSSDSTVDSLTYQVQKDDSTILSDGDFVGQFIKDGSSEFYLTATLLDSASYAGQYTDTVTFTYGLETIA